MGGKAAGGAQVQPVCTSVRPQLRYYAQPSHHTTQNVILPPLDGVWVTVSVCAHVCVETSFQIFAR